MCGIAGFYLREEHTTLQADKLLDALLDGIDHRGGDATGYAAFGAEGLLQIQKAACDAKDFSAGRKLLPAGTRYVLAHTRFATQGHQAWPENNHPILNGKTVAIHNGHIYNDTALWSKAGWDKREAEVDSEIIPALIEAYGWDNAVTALEQLEGAFAVALANCDRPGELILAKGESSPLLYAVTDKLIVWASTEWALISAWKAAIGTPPSVDRIRSLKFGGLMKVIDGKITHEKFTPAFKIIEAKEYKTASKVTGSVYEWDADAREYVDSQGLSLSDKGKRGNARRSWRKGGQVVRKPLSFDEQAWPELEIPDTEVAAIQEINDLRVRTNEIMQAEEAWWENEGILAEFNRCWERIRALREKVTERHFSRAMDNDQDPDEDEMEIACGSCREFTPLPDMYGQDALYCGDCWFFFIDNGLSKGADVLVDPTICEECDEPMLFTECDNSACPANPDWGWPDDGRIHSAPLGDTLALVMATDD